VCAGSTEHHTRRSDTLQSSEFIPPPSPRTVWSVLRGDRHNQRLSTLLDRKRNTYLINRIFFSDDSESKEHSSVFLTDFNTPTPPSRTSGTCNPGGVVARSRGKVGRAKIASPGAAERLRAPPRPPPTQGRPWGHIPSPPQRLSRRGRPSAKRFGVGWGQGLELGVAWQLASASQKTDDDQPPPSTIYYTAALAAAAARPYSRRARPAA
jgi:hypothetical protein